MFTIERRAGRLVEARVFKLATLADVEAYAKGFGRDMLVGQPILLADHRPVAIYPQVVTARLIDLFKGLNVHWERVAIVVSPSNATLTMQLERVVRESRNPSRRVFVEPAEACQFLGKTLTTLELARAAAFLEQPLEPPRTR